ncbi:hypothetical protein ARSEF4850_007197 [Beauveria asiatica]
MTTLSGLSRLDQCRLGIHSLVTPRASNSRALVQVETKSTAPTNARRLTASPAQIGFALLHSEQHTHDMGTCAPPSQQASSAAGSDGRYQIKPVIWPKLDCALCADGFQNF